MIPVCEPLLGNKELEYITDCMNTKWISSKGKYVDQFEQKFASFCGCEYGIATMNGTTAIHLALASIGLQKGDEVIVPSFTMIASVFPIIYCGAKPVLVDADPETWNMNTEEIEGKITNKTRAILPVHIYGHPSNMDPILKLADDYNLFVVEDAAEAHGAEYKGRKTGGIGDVGCFSFYANKIITCGEGGMVVTNDREIAEKARSLKDLSFPKNGERIYLHNALGYNYRMTNLQAAIGLAQLERGDELVEMRRKNAKLYNECLKDLPDITLPTEKSWAKNVYWMYSILVNSNKINRNLLMKKLKEQQIETRPFFIPMSVQPVFENMNLFTNEKYPIAQQLSEKGLHLPSSSGLTESGINTVCNALKEILN